jgi:hypothetical protein
MALAAGRMAALATLLAAAPLAVLADDPPFVDHQPIACTVANRPLLLCATISDDSAVAKSRLYFRRAGEDFYSFVEMEFVGLRYCGTMPGIRQGKGDAIDYYIQAVDDQYQPQRTSTYQMAVQPDGVCEFPPIQTDASKASSITVYATNRKQGKKLDDAFILSGVSFVPVVKR